MKVVKKLLIFIIAMSVIFSSTILGFAGTNVDKSDDKYENIVLGKNYTYGYDNGNNVDIPVPNDTKPSIGLLTDGKYGDPQNWGDAGWNRFLRNVYRSVIFDLGGTYTVNKFSMDFIQDISAGIYFPTEVTYSVSQDGINWSDIGKVKTSISLGTSGVLTQKYNLETKNYQAKYIKVKFPVDVWVFADEIEIYGYKGIVDNAIIPPITKEKSNIINGYLPQGDKEVGRAKDAVLIYNGFYKDDPNVGLNTVDELKPYVGYYDTNNNLKDFMFDSFLFLPLGNSPSGGQYGYSSTNPTNKADWEFYINNTFDSENNLGALDKAVAEVKSGLKKNEYKVNVIIAIPYPNITDNFGDINNDGVSEKIFTLQDQENVLKWYINKVIKKWHEENYKNLRLTGLYWYEETVHYEVPTDQNALISFASKLAKSKGLSLIWIPYYNAARFTMWKSLGFDSAILQPNYAFSDVSSQRLTNAAKVAKEYGMGIEMEIHWNAITNSALRQKWYDYLNAGVEQGYMKDSVHFYYQSGGPGTFYSAYLSKDPAIRAIYDDTYSFIKQTYQKK